MLTLGHVLVSLTNYQITGREPQVSQVVIDSRLATAGSLFVAFQGENVDGHNYVAAAFEQGAICALVEKPLENLPLYDLKSSWSVFPGRPFCLLVENTQTALQTIARYWRQQFDLRVVGVTGSVGKTSSKELIYAVLAQRYTTLKSAGNQNNEIGLPLTLLNELKKPHSHAVLEMGMYAQGEIALLCDIARPVVGVLTMIGPVHLERLGSMEAIVSAKQELVEALPAAGVAILNKDDGRVMSMVNHTKAQIFTYGLDPTADLWADEIRSMGLQGLRFTMHYKKESWHVHVPLLGRHSVHTALRATAVGLVEGLSWEEIIRGLNSLTSQLRLVTVEGPHNSIILDDTYNASPDSVIAALNLLSDLDGRRVAVLGDMLELGAAEEASHRLVGRRAKAVADLLVTVGQRGRIIGEEALAAGMSPGRVQMVDTTAEAIELLKSLIEAEDFVLVKGSYGLRLDHIVTALTTTR